MKLGRLFACIATLSLLLDSAAADPVPEYAMEAAFLYNFALFTEWPEINDDDLTLCIFGRNLFGDQLQSIDGKEVKGLHLHVSHRSEGDNLRDCKMLYVGPAERHSVHKILTQLANYPVLTVTDADGLIRDGIMIEIVVENNRLTFEINAEAAHRAHLSISSKLLRLARFVY